MRNHKNAKLAESSGVAAANNLANRERLVVEHKKILSNKRIDDDRKRFLKFVLESIIPHTHLHIHGNGIAEIEITSRRHNSEKLRGFLSYLMTATESKDFQPLVYEQPYSK